MIYLSIEKDPDRPEVNWLVEKCNGVLLSVVTIGTIAECEAEAEWICRDTGMVLFTDDGENQYRMPPTDISGLVDDHAEA